MADNKKMSVDDILAACRGAAGHDAGPAPAGSAPEQPPKPTAPAADSASVEGQQAGGPATTNPRASAGKPRSEMSMAEVLAAARGQSSGAKSKALAAKAPPKGSGAKSTGPQGESPGKPGKAVKVTEKKPVTGGNLPLDTSSILAAARRGAKPGPISKAEAEAQGKVAKTSVIKPTKSTSAPPMPAKPAYAQPQLASAATPRHRDRRGFFSILLGSALAVGFTTLSVTGLLWLVGLARYLFPNILIEPPSRFKVGFPGDFAPGMVDTKFKAQFGVWIVNADYEGQREIVALKTVCTHLGCTPNWLEAEQKFKCPCHGSGFYKDGVNFEGPAPRPLERYAIRVADDGQLEIDKSKTFQQELGQWKDPDCYVLA